MSGARLTALRLVGFKSFAERTVVEFGPGISAVVGPNGSGKSNLADALRWTLGEQGRSLRTRRAEDVIFAGSALRKGIGMADVTLVIDNTDHLLPVDFGEVEIGRRLYRSGESEYLLNRQKIRLRDLVELLDAGNIADNAFLFIGQGMVDQALALRPEERRPLFEEAAGVRRHDRRRRQAEAELAEAGTNLERLRDLLGELRPQARRMAAQAEQLEARRSAGAELAEALLAATRARWVTAFETERREQRQLEQGRAAADSALAALKDAETAAATTAAQMASHAEQERSRREALDGHRATIVELRVAHARLESETAAISRESQRIADQRAAVERRLGEAAVRTSLPQPASDPGLTAELASIERQLDEMDADESGTSSTNGGHELAGFHSAHAEQARRTEKLATTRDETSARLAGLAERHSTAEKDRDEAVGLLEAAAAAEHAAVANVEAARAASIAASAALSHARERIAQTESEAAAIRARRAVLEATLEAATDDGLSRAARGRGAQLVAEGAEIEPRFRRAVSVALDHASVAFVVDDPVPLAGANRRGALVVRRASPDKKVTSAGPSLVEDVVQLGGGALVDSVRRDPQGELTRLLERVVWLPELERALQIAPALPAGWRAVTLAGEIINDEGVLRLASTESRLDQSAELDELTRSMTELESRLADDRSTLETLRQAALAATATVQPAQGNLDEARRERRAAVEDERVAQRRAEQFLREINWESAQVERLMTEVAEAEALAARTATEIAALQSGEPSPEIGGKGRAERGRRRAALTERRDQLTRRRAAAEAVLAAWQHEQQRAQVQRTMDESRLADLDLEAKRAATREAELAGERERISGSVNEAQLRERAAAGELDHVLAAGSTDRATLVAAERAAAEARERLRVAEAGSRRAEVSSMEARFQLEQIREQLLVELAGIGGDGLEALANAGAGEVGQQDAGLPNTGSEADDAPASDALEAALEVVVGTWQQTPSTEQPPSASRLSILRRRFHELGAGNPFAGEEYAELRTRLESLEAQRTDLESAIESTRELIDSLSALISEQFRSTFAALEDAFARRFHELFGGGDAQLSLTTPDDLSSTGVEIHARPPGKKRQPLSMLSGGERALTAVSLLLAMLEVRPVPFCVLDEVDAALDEANVTRFSKALRGLTQQTQFIVITHNRGTIEGADALYGVTIGDDAVSRVVSLRLPNAESNGDGPAELIAEAALV